MNFDLGSDLHLGFGGLHLLRFPPTSDVLVLAGDIFEVMLLKRKSKIQREIVEYLDYLNSSYKTVIMVMGNHEHYGNSFEFTLQNIRTQLEKFKLNNFVVLEKETFEYKNTIFFGATLWTTMRKRNPVVILTCQESMNDYSQIYIGANHYKCSLNPDDTIAQCYKTLDKIKEFIELQTEKSKILITHMAPSSLSIAVPKKNDDAYYEELFELIADSDIRVAVHGHIHDPVDYEIENCRIVSNPRGYYGYETQVNSFLFKKIEY